MRSTTTTALVESRTSASPVPEATVAEHPNPAKPTKPADKARASAGERRYVTMTTG
jgi:hypothetical protein